MNTVNCISYDSAYNLIEDVGTEGYIKRIDLTKPLPVPVVISECSQGK